MKPLSVRDYRNSLSASFDTAAEGDPVFIRRRNEIYALVCVGKDELQITPELQARIIEAETACRQGHCFSCSTTLELKDFLNSL